MTEERAWTRISALGDATAGSLTGRCLHDSTPEDITPGVLTGAAARELAANLGRPADEVPAGSAIYYVVSSHGTPVAWLTYDACVVVPDAQLTSQQVRHRSQAVQALSRLSRYALHVLAKLRDDRDQRSPGARPEPGSMRTAILVARPQDPTLTWWTTASADLDATVRKIAALTGDPGLDEVLVVETHGYGGYRRGANPVPLPVLCAIEHLAAEHQLPPAAIGEWLHQETASASDSSLATTEQVIGLFGSLYYGRFPSRRTFAEAERDRRGWTAALTAAAIPADLFDLDRFTAHLLAEEIHAVALAGGGIAALRRTAIG
jgi:hypothetical protein